MYMMITYIHKRGCMVADWARSCSEHCGSGQGVGEIVPSNVTPHKTSNVPTWKMLARGMGGEQALCAWISVKCGMFLISKNEIPSLPQMCFFPVFFRLLLTHLSLFRLRVKGDEKEKHK